MMLYHVFDKEYQLVITFDDLDKCKDFLVSESTVAAKSAWVCPWLANRHLSTIPLWEPYDFVDNFPHSQDENEGLNLGEDE